MLALSNFVIMVAMTSFSICDRFTAKIKGKIFKSLYLHFYLTLRVVTGIIEELYVIVCKLY